MWKYINSQNFISFLPKSNFGKAENTFDDIDEENEELYFFSKIFDKEISNKIIDESNKYF